MIDWDCKKCIYSEGCDHTGICQYYDEGDNEEFEAEMDYDEDLALRELTYDRVVKEQNS